jgi:hypothetical protein
VSSYELININPNASFLVGKFPAAPYRRERGSPIMKLYHRTKGRREAI